MLITFDTSGALLGEQKVHSGFWTGIERLPESGRVLLVGQMAPSGDATADAGRPWLHELNATGVVESYFSTPPSLDHWKRTFGYYFGAIMGNTVIATTYNTRSVFFRDRTSGREWSSPVAAPWLRPIDWPKEAPEGTAKVEYMKVWAPRQMMIHRLFGAGPSRFVALIRTGGGDEDLKYGYLVASAAGVSLASSRWSASQILSMKGDTAFAVVEDDLGELVLETRVLQVHRLPKGP